MKAYILIVVSLLATFRSEAQEAKKWTLAECVRYARENNISIQQSELNLRDTEADKKTALGNYLPSVSASATNSWNRGLTQDPISGQNVQATQMNTSANVNASIDLFTGLRNRRQSQRTGLAIIANQYRLDDMKDNISLNVANAFLNILFSVENLKVLEEQKEVTELQIKRTNELIANGVLPKGDVYEIEANLASLEQQIISTENDIRLNKVNLAQIMLIKDYNTFDISTDEIIVDEDSEVLNSEASDIFDVALNTRLNIQALKTDLQLAEQDILIAKSGYSPTLSAFYNLNTRASDMNRIIGGNIDPTQPTREIGFVQGTNDIVVTDNLIPITSSSDPILTQFDRNIGHTYGFRLNVPIFSRFTNDVRTQKSRINLERTQLNYEQTKNELETAVYQAYNDTKGSLKSYEAAQKTAFARQEAHKYAESRFKAGVINSFDYQQVKQRMDAAESQVVQAKYDFLFKLKILEFYFGIPIAEEG